MQQQYATVVAPARSALPDAVASLEAAAARGLDVTDLLSRYRERKTLATKYERAYRQYVWPVSSVRDLKLAPFHVLATEGAVHTEKDRVWHMETIAEVCRAADGVLHATPYRVVDTTDPASEAEAGQWWEQLTETGGGGMVGQPLSFNPRAQQ